MATTPAQVASSAAPRARAATLLTAEPQSLVALVSALASLAAAGTAADVGAVAVAGALELTSARGAALGELDGGDVVVRACLGYDCGSMAPGARLPLSAGLPLTECVRTGRTVVRGGETPGWAAVPVVGADLQMGLLVSLRPGTRPDVAALELLGAATADALARCRPVPSATAGHAWRRSLDLPDWLSAAAVQQPVTGRRDGSGDIVVGQPGSRPGLAWLIVADVCGCGAEAAPTADVVRDIVRPLTAADITPEELLRATDRTLRLRPVDRFVTAAALRMESLGDGRVRTRIATAGHPPVLLWRNGEVARVGTAGPPLNLLDETVAPTGVEVVLGPDDLLFVHTDGLVDRGAVDVTDELESLLTRAGSLGDPATVLDVLVSAMAETTDPSRDDLAAAVVSPRRG
jgi:hypothetical protein